LLAVTRSSAIRPRRPCIAPSLAHVDRRGHDDRLPAGIERDVKRTGALASGPSCASGESRRRPETESGRGRRSARSLQRGAEDAARCPQA
jgi:hypothetical protein